MTFDDRLGWLLLGCAIGFVLGYIVRALRELREEVEAVDAHITGQTVVRRKRPSEQVVLRVALFMVVMISVVAAFLSQRATNEVRDNQAQIRNVVSCIENTFADTLVALNSRTVYSSSQADSNVQLQSAQASFFKAILNPKASTASKRIATKRYLAALNNFISTSKQSNTNRKDFPYPTANQLDKCIDGKVRN